MLNYKKPRFWVIVVAIIAVIVAGIGLLSNPMKKSENDSMNIQTQGPYSMVYLNPIYSVTRETFANARQENEYQFKEDIFKIASNIEADSISVINPEYEEEIVENQITVMGDMSLDVSKYSNKQCFRVITPDGSDTGYIIYKMDDEVWISHWRWYGENKDAWWCEYIIKINSDTDIIDDGNKIQDQTGFDVEKNLETIMSSPKTSSNPQDYINAHKNEYESFFKYGGEDALQYMLTQFEVGNAEGLRGQIMMQLCKELLGARNNVTDDSLSPQEWYDALSIRQEVILPNYEYDGQDTIEKLVYDTEIEIDSASNKRGGFIIVAPKVFGSYEEEDRLKVFVTTYSARYKLFGSTLSKEGGSIIPAAITYRKDDTGRYILEKYEQARDGSEFGPSIRQYCTMPVSGKEIKGLADEIFKHYTDYDDIRTLLYDNLYKHLKKNGITDATLTNSRGEVEFSMSDPKYKP